MESMNLPFAFPALGPLAGLFAVLFALGMILLHITLAYCLVGDTDRLRAQGRPVMVLTPFAWSLAALLLGLVAVAFYWVCHYSRFARTEKKPDAP
jgi:hypothetical protein